MKAHLKQAEISEDLYNTSFDKHKSDPDCSGKMDQVEFDLLIGRIPMEFIPAGSMATNVFPVFVGPKRAITWFEEFSIIVSE